MRRWTYPYLEVLAEQLRKMNEIFEVLAERKYGKLNFRSFAVKAEQKWLSGTSHLWKSRQRLNAEEDLPIFRSPDRTSKEEQRTNGPVNSHLTPGPGIYFNAFIHVYSPRAGADNLLGTNVDVNRKPLSLCPFVASFKTISEVRF